MVRRIACVLATFVTVASITGTITAGLAQSQDSTATSQGFDGKKLFATTCGFCHESGGRVAGKGPKLAGTDRSDEFIVNRVKNDKPGAMPAFGKMFNDTQLKAILGYIRSLDAGGGPPK